MAPAVWLLTLPPLLTHSSSACAKLPPRSACASCIVCTHRLGLSCRSENFQNAADAKRVRASTLGFTWACLSTHILKTRDAVQEHGIRMTSETEPERRRRSTRC